MKINWESIEDFCDIKYERGLDDARGIAKIIINRPEVRILAIDATQFRLERDVGAGREVDVAQVDCPGLHVDFGKTLRELDPVYIQDFLSVDVNLALITSQQGTVGKCDVAEGG